MLFNRLLTCSPNNNTTLPLGFKQAFSRSNIKFTCISASWVVYRQRRKTLFPPKLITNGIKANHRPKSEHRQRRGSCCLPYLIKHMKWILMGYWTAVSSLCRSFNSTVKNQSIIKTQQHKPERMLFLGNLDWYHREVHGHGFGPYLPKLIARFTEGQLQICRYLFPRSSFINNTGPYWITHD